MIGRSFVSHVNLDFLYYFVLINDCNASVFVNIRPQNKQLK